MTTFEHFNNKFQEENQTDENASVNNSDGIRSNNVKINIFSQKRHSLIWNDTMHKIDVSVIASKEKCDIPISTNNSSLEKANSLSNITTSEFKTK